MPKQLQAGFYSDVLLNAIKTGYKDNAIEATKELLHSLSFFETDLPDRRLQFDQNSREYSLLAVYHNYIVRGLPTHGNMLLEQYIANTWGGIETKISDTGSIINILKDSSPEFTKQLFHSLFIIDPRLQTEMLNNTYWKTCLSSDLERQFVHESLPKYLGRHWLQLIEPQRSISNILSYSYLSGENIKELHNQPIDSMGEQRVDFALELPSIFTNDGKKGLIIEIDGSQHTTDRAQFNQDQYRDQAIGCLENTRWATLRIRSDQWTRIPDLLNSYSIFFQDKYFKQIETNYQQPLYKKENGLKALNISLTPIAVARIQMTLIELIFNGILSFQNSVWNIGIVERDIDCAWIAIEDFKDFWKKLNELSGYSIPLPEIRLTIYNTTEFSIVQQVDKLPITKATQFKGDLLIDISILQRWGLTESIRTEQNVYSVSIRSAHSKKKLRQFISAPLINYQPLIEKQSDQTLLYWERIQNINYIIKSVFRKQALRPGQLPIIDRALQQKSVIGLLPTGGGKSITYQLCSLLQPGTAIIIDPIKSLMQDQSEGLIKNDIDATLYINSSIKTYYERRWAQEQLIEGRTLFAFVSPERLQIPNFRAALAKMSDTNGHYFSYCIIDEAHCVSEWGHDFRTSYLKLGENARKYCKIWQHENSISLFGLTATASFDVLSDVKRELQISDEGVISSLDVQRKELIYQIHPVKTNLPEGATGYGASQAVGNAKINKIQFLLNQLPEDIYLNSKDNLRPQNLDRQNFFLPNEKNKFENAVLIFCPHKSENSPMGVRYVEPRLITNPTFKTGTFYGADKNEDNASEVTTSELNQTLFIKDELNILVATKAFGMGIDKPNVRSTIHFNFPSSIESFVQEAGRAGRDRKRAICHILYSDASHIDRNIISSFHANNFKGTEQDYEKLNELLQEISYPSQKIANEIAYKVFEDLGEVVQIRPWQRENLKRIYVNKAFGIAYGFIDSNLRKDFRDRNQEIEQELAREVLDYIVHYIQANCPGSNYFEWVETEIIDNTQPGIEAILSRSRPGETLPELEVGFRNNRINLMTQLLKSNVDERISEVMVQSASTYCNDMDEFYKKLATEFYKREEESISHKLPPDIHEMVLEKYFRQIRDEIDTFKAVYRLSILGVIDDYEVDYNKKSIKLHITKKRDEDYIHHLEEYLNRYLSPKRVKEIMNKVEHADRGSTIRNCAYTLIDYVYNFIAQKRERAILDMNEICEIGITSQDYEEIERNINLYFTSKYISEMLEMTNNGAEFSLDVVTHFIEEAHGIGDNLEHLRGSTTRILADNPENGALLLLRAYAALLLETKYVRNQFHIRNQFLVNRALEDLENGLIKFEENGDKMLEVLNLIRTELLVQNPGLDVLIDELSMLLSVKQHHKWLTKFNKHFIS